MAAFWVRSLVLFYFAKQCCSFTFTENTYKYIDIVNNNQATLEVTCKCSDRTAMCNCAYYKNPFLVEAPFAALLQDPPPTKLWPPPGIHYPLPFIPADSPEGLRFLKGDEHPLPAVKVMPRDLDVIRARFKLFLKVNNAISSSVVFRYDNLAPWPEKMAVRPEVVYIVIHGWTSSDIDPSIRSLRAYLLLRNVHTNLALVSVNWFAAATESYRQSAADALVIGREVGYLIYKLVETGRTKAENVHLIGVDMGSHIAKIATNVYTQFAIRHTFATPKEDIGTLVGRRTGLNPLATYFSELRGRASAYDAEYVDIIHTTTADNEGDLLDILNRRYGTSTIDVNNNVELDNQIDFYPNNGKPVTCPPTEYGCGLNLAIKYFKASLLNGYNRTLFATNERSAGLTRDRSRTVGSPYTALSGVMGIDAPSSKANGNQFGVFTLPTTVNNVPSQASQPTCSVGPLAASKHPSSNSLCGLSATAPHRAFQGTESRTQQLPWTVCILTAHIGYVNENIDANGKIIVKGDFQWPREAEDVYKEGDGRRIIFNAGYLQTCTGTLIEYNWVVTAAHCFKRVKNLVPIYLVFGSPDCMNPYDKNANVRRVIVEKRDSNFNTTQTVFIHGSYPKTVMPLEKTSNDIALIRLDKPVTTSGTIIPICYREAQNYPYDDCSRLQVAGHGTKGVSANIPDPRLTWLRANIIHEDNARHSFVNSPKYGVISGEETNQVENIFAFGNFEPSGRAICSGDSGGPVIDWQLGGDKRATLVGVTRSATGDCATASVNTRRKFFDPTYVENDPDGGVWKRQLSTATKIKPYLVWILITTSKAKNNKTPRDIFVTPKDSRHLATGPGFGVKPYPQYTPAQPAWYNFTSGLMIP